jgi:Phage integrase family
MLTGLSASETTMNDSTPPPAPGAQRASKKGKLTGPKPPLRPGHVWCIRARLQLERRTRDLVLFNLAIDSKLRGCDLVALRVDDVAPNGYAVDRATIRQRKTGRPVRFELTEVTRQSLDDYLRDTSRKPGQCVLPGPRGPDQHLTTRQYARLVSQWVGSISLDPLKYATHSMRRTKATLIYRRTGNIRAVQLLLGTPRSKAQCATSGSRWTMRLRSQRKSRSEIPGQSCRALPTNRWTRSCQKRKSTPAEKESEASR